MEISLYCRISELTLIMAVFKHALRTDINEKDYQHIRSNKMPNTVGPSAQYKQVTLEGRTDLEITLESYDR
jgi:hypothetical protein